MRKTFLILASLLLFCAFSGISQILNGRVLNESGANAASVLVQFQNKSNTVITNADGTFKILATKLPDTLDFSAVGMESYKVVITEKNIKDPDFAVVMLNKRKTMNEVVVTSMGASRQPKELAYSTADSKLLEVSGKVPGVKIEEAYASKSDRVILRGYKSSTSPSGTIDLKESIPGSSRFFSRDTNIGSRTGQLAKSKVITAGEVNDFNKWKMWEDYNENEFKTFSEFWGMKSNNRFSIQLTDKRHNAIMNEPLFLVNKNSKDTVWRTFTDNTGKAELWADFFNGGQTEILKSIKKEDYFITDRSGNVLNNPSEFSQGVNLLVADKSCQFSNDVDIAFVVDATGSMEDEIEFLKLELEDVIRSTMDKYSSLSLRAASVFYRDKRDEYLTKNVPFNDDLLKTLNFIKLQNAKGGGDFPEAVDDALEVALDSLQWSKSTRTKLLFLILDAPPHKEAKEKIQQQILKAAAMGIRIVPIACSGTDKSTEFLLRSMALATNGTYTFLTNHSGIGNDHIEPTTDKYEVELLNNLLQRVIGQFLYAKDCSKDETQQVQQPDTRQPDNILSLKIYPNPTNGRFTIESKKDIREIFIADFSGKLLMKLAVTDKKGRWQVDISNYPAGVYLVKYITADNKWGAEKVVLMR